MNRSLSRICRMAVAAVVMALPPAILKAQDTAPAQAALTIQLNTLADVEGACRLTFVARNETGADIDQAVFETVVFDSSGGVISLSLFDFRALPADRPRVRQFDLPGVSCDNLGQALINGASTCDVGGSASTVCRDALVLESRLDVELLG